MREAEWLNSADPMAMLRWITDADDSPPAARFVSKRKLRLICYALAPDEADGWEAADYPGVPAGWLSGYISSALVSDDSARLQRIACLIR